MNPLGRLTRNTLYKLHLPSQERLERLSSRCVFNFAAQPEADLLSQRAKRIPTLEVNLHEHAMCGARRPWDERLGVETEHLFNLVGRPNAVLLIDRCDDIANFAGDLAQLAFVRTIRTASADARPLP